MRHIDEMILSLLKESLQNYGTQSAGAIVKTLHFLTNSYKPLQNLTWLSEI